MSKIKRISSIITASLFLVLILGGSLLCILMPDAATSLSERRPLEQFPTISKDNINDGTFFEKFDKYAADQLPFRDQLRAIKAFTRFNLLGRLENNGIVIKDDTAIKLSTSYNEALFKANIELWSKIVSKNFASANLYYSIVPDKGYFLSDTMYPHLDYDKLMATVRDNAPAGATEITISDKLTVKDYYSTDLHWKQENIYPIASYLAEVLGTTIDAESTYTDRNLGDFYGVYTGQSALPLAPDSLVIRENGTTSAVSVYTYGSNGLKIERKPSTVYGIDSIDENDMYSVYLAGSEAIVEIVNPNIKNGKTLAIFRDSYTSSLAPYLMSGYERVILLDTRYMASAALGSLPQLRLSEVTDVLFLYSVTTITETVMR